jgi:hypothetical protein
MAFTKQLINTWNIPSGVLTPTLKNTLRQALENLYIQGKTDGRQYSRATGTEIRIWSDAAAANEWISYLMTTVLAPYLTNSVIQDYSVPTFTKKLVSEWDINSPPLTIPMQEKLTQMISANKTDGTNYTTNITPKIATRIWTNSAAAAEWATFMGQQPIATHRTGYNNLNNDILPITIQFDEFSAGSLTAGQNIEDPTGSFDIFDFSFTINNGVGHGSGVAISNLTASNETLFANNVCKTSRIWHAEWASGSTYPGTRVAMYYQSWGAAVFWILDPNDLSNGTAVSSGTFKFPVTLRPRNLYTAFHN